MAVTLKMLGSQQSWREVIETWESGDVGLQVPLSGLWLLTRQKPVEEETDMACHLSAGQNTDFREQEWNVW